MKTAVYLIIAIGLGIASQFEYLVENILIPYLHHPLSYLLRLSFHWVPFSIGLIIWYLLIPVLLYLVFRLLKNKQIKYSFFIKIACAIYVFYMLTWGILYNRVPLNVKLNLNIETEPKLTELKELAEALVDSTNKYAVTYKGDLNLKTIENLSIETYAKNSEFKVNVPYAHIKKATGSTLLSYLNTAGIYNFMSAEANVNSHNLAFEMPFTVAHELAHQAAIAHEDEANYLAYLVCKNSGNLDMNYSAYYGVVFRSINALFVLDSTAAKLRYSKLSETVKNHRKLEKKQWELYTNPIDTYITRPFYDLFLKSNGVQEGAISYGKVINLLIAENRKKKEIRVIP